MEISDAMVDAAILANTRAKLFGGEPKDWVRAALQAALAAREAEAGAVKVKPFAEDALDLAAFAKDCVQVAFEGCDLGGGEIQDLAVHYGILQRVKFDPAIHTDPNGDSEKGDPWFVYSPDFKAALASPAPHVAEGWTLETDDGALTARHGSVSITVIAETATIYNLASGLPARKVPIDDDLAEVISDVSAAPQIKEGEDK